MAHNGCLGVLGFLLVAFGLLLVFKTVMVSGVVLLALAVAFAAAYLSGVAGRWSLGVAALLLLFATPYLLVKGIGLVMGLFGWLIITLFKLLPVVFLALGIYVLVRALR